MRKCSICGEYFEEFGNNAHPVNNGTCCDKCNREVVIPIRIKNMMKKNKENSSEEK